MDAMYGNFKASWGVNPKREVSACCSKTNEKVKIKLKFVRINKSIVLEQIYVKANIGELDCY